MSVHTQGFPLPSTCKWSVGCLKHICFFSLSFYFSFFFSSVMFGLLMLGKKKTNSLKVFDCLLFILFSCYAILCKNR